MAADDYGLNFGLKPSQRTPSPAAIKRRQRRQKRTVDAANKTIDRLARNPGLAATRSLLSVSSALHPDNPYYANTLDQLNQTVSGIPGVQPDAAAAMVAGSITPDSKAGSELVSLQNQQQLQQNLQDLKLQQIKREAAQASEEARVAAENNSPLGYVKALSQVSFNALDFIHQVEMNAIRQAINTEDDMANPLLSFATALAKGETYANTDLGLNIMGGLDYITTGKLNDSQLDMGDGFLPEPESPVLKLKKSWDQQMMGTAGRNMRTIELEQPDGTIVRQIVDDSPATPGQWVASDVFDFDIGTRPYQIMSGTLDAGSYLLDPSMYLTARGITAGFVKAENALLRKPLGMEAHPTAADLTTAMEAGQAIRVGDQAASQVTEAQRRAQASQEALAENQAKIDEARQAWQLLNGAIADARSPEARAAAQEAASAAARETMTPAAREVAEAATAESQARQADLIAEEQADRIREVSDATLANARQQHGKLYTPRQEAAEGAVRAVERSDGKFDLIHASGARIAERDTLEEATSLADELSRMPGYDPQRTIDQVEAWDYVVDRATRNGLDAAPVADDAARAADDIADEAAPAADDAAPAADDAAPAADAPPGATDEAARTVEDNPAGTATAANIDQLLAQRDNLEQSLTELSQLRDELVSYGDSVAIHLERSEQFARAQAKLLADQMKQSKLIKGEREPASDELDDVLEFLRDPAGIGDKSGVNGVNVDRALGFITNSYNGGWVALLDSFAAIKDPAILQEATNGKLGAEALRDLAEASNQQQVRMALAKHMARPDALSVNMGRLRGLKIAAQAKYGQDLDRVVSRYGQLFGHTALNSVSWGKQIKRAAVPWSQARHIEDEDGVLDLVFDHITYALSMNRPVSRGKGVGFSDKGGTGRRAFEGKEPELDANGIPVVDQAGQPVMKSEFEDVEYQSALEFRREWVRQFVNAKTGQERRALWNRLNSELVDRAADIQGLPYQLRQQFKDALRLSKMDAKNYTKYNTTTRAEIRDNQLYLDGELVADDFAAMEAQMSDFLLAPDWEEMRRAMTSAKAVLETGGVVGTGRDLINEITGTVFERYWRTSVIAFRGAYLIRNMADIQFRMYMAGHPSLLTNPLGITALATSHLAAPSGSLGRALNKMGDKVAKSLSKMKIGDTDLLGRSFYDELEPDVASYLRTYVGSEVDEYASNAFQTIVSQRHSHADPGTGAPQRRQTIAYEDIQAPAAGTKVSAANRYFDGWEFELGLLRRSPMAMMAFDVTYGGEIPAFLRKFAGADQSEPQRALVAWLINDKEGRKILDRARDGSGEIRKLTGDPDIDNGEMLYRWLFGDGPGSMMSQWRRLTLDGDPALVKAVRQPKPEKQEDFWQQRRDTRNLIKQRVSDPSYGFVADGVFTQERLPVGAVLADIVHEQKTSKFWQRYDGLVNGFFDASSRFEYAAGYLPEFRFYKWDRAAELAALLSPEDAAKLLDNAKAALGTKHAPNAWAAKTLRRLERGTKNAKGGGAFTLDDLDYATNVMAAKNVKELFYDARNRNQFANSVRLLAPFAQPWANTMIQWTKLAAQNPGRIYAAGVLFTAAQGRNSNWLQDDPMSPNDAFFYRDPKTRQLTVGVPAMGPAIGMLANLNPVDNARELTGGTSVNVDPSLVNSGIQLQSMNLLFQDGLLPGAGPVVTLSAGMLERFGWYRSSVPDVVKDFMIGSVNADPDADPTVASTVLPAWLQGILGSLGLRDWAPKVEKYMPHAMAALSQVNPDGRYYSVSPQGDIQQSDAQRAAFVMDSEHYAASMLFGRSLVQNVAPGAPMVNQLMVMDDGRIMAQAKLSQEYLSTLRESGDKTQALTTLLERYGTDAVFAILPTRGSSITPTNDAYQFLRNNPGKAEKFGPVLGLIFPEGGYSARMDRYQRQTSNNPKLSADETAKYINSYMKDAAQAQIDKRYIAGELTREQYEAESAGLTKSYEEAGARMPNYGNFGEDAAAWRAGLLDAASDPDLMEADKGGVLKAVKQYEEYRTHAQQRSGNESFGSVEMTEWRAWLRKKGGELIQQYPSFRVAWTKVYENEVEETLR